MLAPSSDGGHVESAPYLADTLEIAPPTHLAMAIRKDPGIVPLIKQVVTMAVPLTKSVYEQIANHRPVDQPEG